ncbi:MAG: HNH endonuclease [Geobacter sp.]
MARINKPLTEEQKQRKRELRRKRYLWNYEKEKEYRKAYYETNKDKFKEWQAANYEANKEEIRAKGRAKYKENNEEIRIKLNAYYKATIEKQKEYSKRKYEKNKEAIMAKRKERENTDPEKYVQYRAKYYQDNKERVDEVKKKWSARNKDKLRYHGRLHAQKRRQLARENGGELSKDIVPRLMELQRGKCRACGKPLKNDYHIDHIIPLARGGQNTDNNCQLLHSKCNLSKGARDPYEHAQKLGVLFI